MSWLVCDNTLPEGRRVPALIRRCSRCAIQVWVSVKMTPAVDSGELQPLCTLCYALEKPLPVAIDPRQVDELADAGVLDFAQEWVRQANGRRGGPT